MGEDGPLLVPVLTDTTIDSFGAGKVSSIRTIFGKPVVSKGPDAVSISSRIRAGQLVYADTGVQEKGGDPEGDGRVSNDTHTRPSGTRNYPPGAVLGMHCRSPETQNTKLEIAVLLGILRPSQETALKSKKSTSQ